MSETNQEGNGNQNDSINQVLERLEGIEKRLGESSRQQAPKDPPEQETSSSSSSSSSSTYDDPSLSIDLIQNPRKVLEDFEKRIDEKWEKKLAKKDQSTKFWQDFFNRHEDLQDHQEIVDFVFEKNRGSFQDLSLNETAEKMATLTRSMIRKIKGDTSEAPVDTTKTHVEGANSKSSSSRGGGSPNPSDSSDGPAESFKDQLKKISAYGKIPGQPRA